MFDPPSPPHPVRPAASETTLRGPTHVTEPPSAHPNLPVMFGRRTSRAGSTQTTASPTRGLTTSTQMGPSLATEGRILIVGVMRAEVAEAVESNCLPLARPRSTAGHLLCNPRLFAFFRASKFDAREESDGRRLNSRRPTVSRGGATRVNVYTFSQAPASSIDPPASGLGGLDAPASIQIVPGLAEIPRDVRTDRTSPA